VVAVSLPPTPQTTIKRPVFVSLPPQTTFQNASPYLIPESPDNHVVTNTPKKLRFSGINMKESPFKIQKADSSSNLQYEGEFLNGLKHGFGKLKKDQIEIFIGEWEEDFFNGEGVLLNPLKLNDLQENPGNLLLPNQHENTWIKYEGEFKNGKMSGFGTIYFENGDKYRGYFKEGSAHGEGSYYKETENVWITAKWNYNKLVCFLSNKKKKKK
jgi:hypothetical protein